MPVSGSILWKPLRDSHYVVASLQPDHGGLRQLVVAQSLLVRLQSLARATSAEQLIGLLIGQRFDCPQSGARWVLIDSVIEGIAVVPDVKALSGHLSGLHARRGDAGECVGWYCGTTAGGAHLSRVSASVHATTFEGPWQTALILANDGRAGAFYLHDARDARWFQAPFYEVTDTSRNSRREAAQATSIAWPEYITTRPVSPLVIPNVPPPTSRPRVTALPERVRPERVEAPVESPRAERVAQKPGAALTLVRDASARLGGLGATAASSVRGAAGRLRDTTTELATGVIPSAAATVRDSVVSLGRHVAARATNAAQEWKQRAEAARQARAAREAEERRRKEEHARRQAERARQEAERAREAAELRAREAAARKAREEAERAARLEAERVAREEAERTARLQAERAAEMEAERRARQAEMEAERRARLEEMEAERRVRAEAEARERLEAAERARVEAERALLEEAERSRQRAVERARLEAREREMAEAAERAKVEAAERVRVEAEERARAEAERQARREAERQSAAVAPAADRQVPRVVTRERSSVAVIEDLEDTTAADRPYRYLALARREGFQVSAQLERGTPERPETVWLLNEPESGLRLTVVTTDDDVREACLHYNIRTDDDALLRITPPEHRDVDSRTIYVREPCIAELRSRCRRLRATGALTREWKVTPDIHPNAAPAQYR
jgi:hypothetical protein